MPLLESHVVGETATNVLFKEDGEVDTLAWSIEYTKRLEEKGRFQLCIWPEHCLIGTPGHNVVSEVRDALDEWSDATGKSVEWVEKGQNLLTEMYSALCAEVPVNEKTSFDTNLLDSVSVNEFSLTINTALHGCKKIVHPNSIMHSIIKKYTHFLQLKQSKKLLICGQAMSHCVNYTVRDIVEHWPKDERNKITLLRDCASSVPGFEAASEKFIEEMVEAGVILETSENVAL